MKFTVKIPKMVEREYVYIANVIMTGNFEGKEIEVDMEEYKKKRREIALSIMGTFISMIPKKWLVKIIDVEVK